MQMFRKIEHRVLPALCNDFNVWILFFILLNNCVFAHVYTNEFAVHLSGDENVAKYLAKEFGFVYRGQIGSLKGYYLYEHHYVQKRSVNSSVEHHELLLRHPAVLWVEQQHVKRRVKRATYSKEELMQEFPDPLYPDQWFLHGGGNGGYDMNVLPAWKKGFTGKGVVVSILDDGIQTNHPDLVQNYDEQASLDINGQDADPTPQDNGDNKHGTRCAGEVAAVAYNEFCGVGVAYNSSIGGVRMLDGSVTDATEATALSHNPDHIHIYSASWGPEDDGKTVDGPGPLAKLAFTVGIEKGRSGLGSIFVWASGNGGRYGDSCNCDGYTNSIYTLSISSATQSGLMPWYLEQCSSTLATTYSSGTVSKDKSITTVDMDYRYFKDLERGITPDPVNLCTKSHTGTSASAPIAAGICALALEANKQLTWRDMQYLVVITSRSEPLKGENGWVKNGVGRFVSSKFGYGLMDAAAMVELAKQWHTVPPQHICNTTPDNSERIVPANTGGQLEVSMSTSGCKNSTDAVSFLEHVQVKVTLHYKPRGNLRIILVSPAGTPSTVLLPRPHDVQEGSFNDWPFMSVHFWGEKPEGTWKLIIINDGEIESQEPGKLSQWSLVFYGTQIEVNSKPSKRTEHRSPQPPYSFHQNSVQPLEISSDAYMSDCFIEKKFQINSGHYMHCEEKCPIGQYGDLKDYVCHMCDKSCLSCYGPSYDNCLSCPEKTFLSKSLCVKTCSDGFYSDTDEQICAPCSELCSSCQYNSFFCVSCKPHLFLYDHMCVPACPKDTFLSNLICQKCHRSCSSCFGPSESECLSCLNGLFLFHETCLPKCPKGYYEYNQKCKRCHHSCKTCSSKNNCNTCLLNGIVGNAGFCVAQANEKCVNGRHVITFENCESCADHCIQCLDSSKKCVYCEAGYYWVHGNCVNVCPNGTYSDDGAECYNCEKFCKKCIKDTDQVCLACEDGFFLHNGTCFSSCPDGYYADKTGFCQKCSPLCFQCIGEASDDCTSCLPNFHYINGKCYTSCPENTYSSLNQKTSRLECIPCYHLCKACTGFGPNKCKSCYENSTVLNRTCIPCLDDEYFDSDSLKCQRCHDKCGRCDGSSEYNCLSCQAPLRLNKSSHSCLPCCNKENDKSSNCCACSKDLDICINSADHPRSIANQAYDSDDAREIIIPVDHILPIIVSICAAAILLFVLLFAILQTISMGCCELNIYGRQYERVPSHLAARFDAEMEKVSLTQDCPDDDDDIYEKA